MSLTGLAPGASLDSRLSLASIPHSSETGCLFLSGDEQQDKPTSEDNGDGRWYYQPVLAVGEQTPLVVDD